MTKKIRPQNKCIITCTDTNQRVKAQLIRKTDMDLSVELPTGYVMNLQKKDIKRKVYVCQIGTWEFISDGWLQT